MKKTMLSIASIGALLLATNVAPAEAQVQEVPRIITGTDLGGGPHVRGFAPDGTDLGPSFLAYGDDSQNIFRGGVRVGTADVAGGDGGDEEILTGPGYGGPHFRSFKVDGQATVGEFSSEMVFEHETGIFVAGGDIATNVGIDEVVVGPNVAPPGEKYEDGSPVESFVVVGSTEPRSSFAFVPYEGWFGEVRVAVGNVDADANDEIITAPGPGGGPHVRVWDYVRGASEETDDLIMRGEFMAYAPAFGGGVYLGVADVEGDGDDEILTSAGPGGGPHVKAIDFPSQAVDSQWMAYAEAFRGGVRAAGGQLDDDAPDEVVTGPGPGGGPHIRTFNFSGSQATGNLGFQAYAEAMTAGMFVAIAEVGPGSNNNNSNNSTSSSSSGSSPSLPFRIEDGFLYRD